MNRDEFPPTDTALQARLEAIEPHAYSQTRNRLDGAVTRLSPYLTHGFSHVPAVIVRLRRQHALRLDHKLIFELAWREYFHHLWDRLGDGIFDDLRPLPGSGYRDRLPDDLLQGRTGVPAIDNAVRALYDSGYLHNHARMWLASYAVHLRKVDWRAGADWMVGHLLDGDLASNHLSWQWVAGTMNGKPYLFNADNVARYAPEWASPGTVIDQSYEALEALARGAEDSGAQPQGGAAIDLPALHAAPPEGLRPPPAALPAGTLTLLHPWSLARPAGPAVAVIVTDFHQRWPWSARRWAFVLERMRALTPAALVGSRAELAAQLAGRPLAAVDTPNPHYRELLRDTGAALTAAPRFFENPQQPCRSFTQFWQGVQSRPPF
jgi:deoxyribodipyrimidine photo-lyase